MHKKNKKAQIGLFLILGFIILIASSFLIYLKNFQKSEEIEVKEASEFLPVKNFIKSCLNRIAKDGIYFISLQGGYYEVPNLSESFADVRIPYYWYYNESKLPDKKLIEKEFSNYIENRTPNCINNFNSFKDIGHKIDSGIMSIKSKIALKNVDFEVNYPTQVTIGPSVIYIDKFIITIQTNFNENYELVRQIIEEQKQNPDFIPAGFISELALENNFTFANIYLDENSILYTLIFNEEYNKEPLIYSFFSKYNWNSSLSDNAEIKKIEELTAYPDYLFRYEVNLTGDKFIDYTDLFDINENTGVIDFIPRIEDIGSHLILVKAYDKSGNEESEVLKLKIVGENKPPAIEESGDIEIKVGEELNLTVKASDVENDPILYSVKSNLLNLTINPLSGELNFKAMYGQQGIYTIVVSAIDVHSNLDEDTFSLVIKND